MSKMIPSSAEINAISFRLCLSIRVERYPGIAVNHLQQFFVGKLPVPLLDFDDFYPTYEEFTLPIQFSGYFSRAMSVS